MVEQIDLTMLSKALKDRVDQSELDAFIYDMKKRGRDKVNAKDIESCLNYPCVIERGRIYFHQQPSTSSYTPTFAPIKRNKILHEHPPVVKKMRKRKLEDIPRTPGLTSSSDSSCVSSASEDTAGDSDNEYGGVSNRLTQIGSKLKTLDDMTSKHKELTPDSSEPSLPRVVKRELEKLKKASVRAQNDLVKAANKCVNDVVISTKKLDKLNVVTDKMIESLSESKVDNSASRK